MADYDLIDILRRVAELNDEYMINDGIQYVDEFRRPDAVQTLVHELGHLFSMPDEHSCRGRLSHSIRCLDLVEQRENELCARAIQDHVVRRMQYRGIPLVAPMWGDMFGHEIARLHELHGSRLIIDRSERIFALLTQGLPTRRTFGGLEPIEIEIEIKSTTITEGERPWPPRRI